MCIIYIILIIKFRIFSLSTLLWNVTSSFLMGRILEICTIHKILSRQDSPRHKMFKILKRDIGGGEVMIYIGGVSRRIVFSVSNSKFCVSKRILHMGDKSNFNTGKLYPIHLGKFGSLLAPIPICTTDGWLNCLSPTVHHISPSALPNCPPNL